MIEKINNNSLEVMIESKGAELVSLKNMNNSEEYIWEADPKYWGKHSPLLFPFIGFSKDNEYIYDGKTYPMTKHGFARDKEFTLVEKTEVSLKYLLEDTEETLLMYPFEFNLFVEYVLVDNKLEVNYHVVNKSKKKMFFSIGGHPAFKCNVASGDVYLQFEKEEILITNKINLDNGLIKEETEMVLEKGSELRLNNKLFREDALIFKNLNSSWVMLHNKSTNKKLKFNFKEFPYLAFWRPEAAFLCIEPWYGIADYDNTNKRIEDKIGVQSIHENEEFNSQFVIEII